jgi:hypothetical protein
MGTWRMIMPLAFVLQGFGKGKTLVELPFSMFQSSQPVPLSGYQNERI